ncbi:deoxyribonuclease I [Stieleria sp. TO1_6]|uniref:deoxyribonuclease I n=1 Tax=Stieleria tagensis TaxID=2956795 RepID=UPI00209B8881|nr:deoxyribonuclease I [Stieleria tagensis]MCO8122625.1 deoxyribonuclease I [Stieleria tagensis]
MDDSRRSIPIFKLIVICAMIGGAVYFAKNFKVKGLDGLSIHPKTSALADPSAASDQLSFITTEPGFSGDNPFLGSEFATPSPFAARPTGVDDGIAPPAGAAPQPAGRGQPLRIGSWALSGFGPSKLASDHARIHLVRIIRKFDVIALQQITAAERDLVPRLVDAINEGGRHFDFVLGQPTGPSDRSEQLAILFNIDRVNVDRTQTYTVADPHNRMTYDPMVAWFRAAQPPTNQAWTFSVVNVRIHLARAAAEVAVLPNVFASVRQDGRGEDDVVMAGLFQADDSYLIPRIMGAEVVAAVSSATTDIFNRHQTCNVLVDRNHTSEYLGRGGPHDFLRIDNLNLSQAEAISSHLPVFAEFTLTEAGMQ